MSTWAGISPKDTPPSQTDTGRSPHPESPDAKLAEVEKAKEAYRQFLWSYKINSA